jgi:hypothetical protein
VAGIVQVLVERVDVAEDGIGIRLRTEGLEPRPGPPGRHADERRCMSRGAGVACDEQSVTVQVPLTFRRWADASRSWRPRAGWGQRLHHDRLGLRARW